MVEVKITLQAKQKELLQKLEHVPVIFYGGAKGGGKSYALRRICLLKAMTVPNITIGIFRRTFPELDGNHIRPILTEFPFLRQFYNEAKKLITLPNNATIQFCHCNNEADISLYQGREFDLLCIDEAGEWSEAMFRTLQGSNRSSKPNIKPRLILTGNPGGQGHGWLKRLFIEKKYKDGERESDYSFIQALVQDNQALLENDPDYIHKLKAQPNEALRKAYLYGDWDIFAGQFFNEIDRSVHFIKTFNIPHHWNRFGAYDFGFNHPAAFGWFASDEDGNVYMYREFIKPKLRVDEFCRHLKTFPDTERLYPIVAGHDCWTKKGILNESSPPTIAEEFFKHGISLKKATIDRVQGAAHLRKYLAWQNKGDGVNKPRLFIMDTCPITFDCLTRMQHDPDNVEDVLKVDSRDGDIYTGDDPYDMIRYALMTRPAITDPLPKNLPWGSDEWAKQEADLMEKAAIEHFESLEEQAGFV